MQNELTDEELKIKYQLPFAAAYVRSLLPETSKLNDSDAIRSGLAQKVDLHMFKHSRQLARVQAVLGVLKQYQPQSILDVGTGKGVFLWTFLEHFTGTPIHCLDLKDSHVNRINAIGQT